MDLMELLPGFYRASPEMTALQAGFTRPVEDLWRAYDQLMDQLDIRTATWGLRRWEEQYGLPTDVSKPLEERRARLLSKVRGQGVTTAAMLRSVAESFVNGTVEVREFPASHWFEIAVREAGERQPDFRGLIQAVGEIRPAHLGFHIRDLPRPIGFQEALAFRLQQLGIWVPFRNYRQEVVLLDGSRPLAGDWLLNQVLQGMAFSSFQVAGLSWHTALVWQTKQFAMQMAIPIVNQARLQQMGVHIPFQSYLQDVVWLDGQGRLDGDWLLNQVLQGIAFPAFQVTGLSWHTTPVWQAERMGISLLVANGGAMGPLLWSAALSLREMGRVACSLLCVALAVRTQQIVHPGWELTTGWAMREHLDLKTTAALSLPVPFTADLDDLRLTGIKTTWSQRLSAGITIDSLYHLDGEAPLDGRRTLNANIREERI